MPSWDEYEIVTFDVGARDRCTENCARRVPLSPSTTDPLETVTTALGPASASESTIVAVPVDAPTVASAPLTPWITIENVSSSSIAASVATGTLMVDCTAPAGIVTVRGWVGVPQRV